MLRFKQIKRIYKLKTEGLSQREIAKKIGIAKDTVTKYSNPKIIEERIKQIESHVEILQKIKEATTYKKEKK